MAIPQSDPKGADPSLGVTVTVSEDHTSPVASATMDCASAPNDAPTTKLPLSACAMSCVAVSGETIAHVEPIAFVPLSPWTLAHTGLFGFTSAPATPPSQIV